jgi:hypothetical protein
MAQSRRADDMSVQLLDQKLDKFFKESTLWRKEMGDEVKECKAQIKCLADHFIKYKPQLESARNRKMKWADFWEKRKDEALTAGVRAGFLLFIGSLFYWASDKVVAWIRTVI